MIVRYRWDGSTVLGIESHIPLGVTATIVGLGPSIIVDVEMTAGGGLPADSRNSLDEYMATFGWIFARRRPSSTIWPAVVAMTSALTSPSMISQIAGICSSIGLPSLAIRDGCQRFGVPFFFKQWGGVRKHLTGRLLDGRTWDEMPRPKRRRVA